jgi:acyl-CoA thioester hydrolase
MLNDFTFKINVQEQWIDYNHHMQDAYYGLVFSYAVDHFQDVVGFDKSYRSKTDAQYS